MNTLFVAQREISPPQLCSSIGGGLGGGQMHKRTTPKTFGHAKELHRNMSPAEAKLWQHLRAHRWVMSILETSMPSVITS
jgi:hypothetical protein